MKKLIFISVIFLSVVSCHTDESCQSRRSAINEDFDRQIQTERNNPGPLGVNEGKISLLNEEREKQLREICN